MIIIYYLFIFLFIYNPPIVGLPMNSGVLIGAFCFIYYFVKYIFNFKGLSARIAQRNIWPIIIILLILITYSFLVGIASQSFDFQLSKNYTSFLIFYLPGAIFFSNKLFALFNLEKVLKFIEAIVLGQAIIIIIMLLLPDFKLMIYSILKDGDVRLKANELSGGFRFLSFAYGTTWDLAFLQSLALIFLSIRIRIYNNKITYFDLCKLLLIAISSILSGRTGFIGILFSIIILFLPLTISNFSLKKSLTVLLKTSVITISIGLVSMYLLPNDIKTIINDNFIPWAFEMFENKSGGKIETESSNELINKMYFEISKQTLIFGDGYYVNPTNKDRYYKDTDAGYMRHVLYYGIIGTAILLFFYVKIFSRMLMTTKVVKYSSFFKGSIYLIMIYFFVAHLKGDLLSGSDMVIKYLFLMLLIFVLYNKKRNLYGNS